MGRGLINNRSVALQIFFEMFNFTNLVRRMIWVLLLPLDEKGITIIY